MSLSNKKLFIILGVTTLVLVGITVLLILLTQKSNETANDTNNTGSYLNIISHPSFPADDESALAVKSLTQTYYSPNINFWNPNRKIEITNALKDHDLETKLTQEMQKLCDQTDRVKLDLEKTGDYISTNCNGNISPTNVLSFATNIFAPYNYTHPEVIQEDPEINLLYINSHVVTKNYRLDTGEEIKFGDLFVDGTDLTPILTKAAYEAVHCHTNYCGGGAAMQFIEIADVDNEVISILTELKNTENITFSFNDTTIDVYTGDYTLTIRMVEHYDKIAIFNRFQTSESIYKTAPTTPQFVFSTYQPNYKNDFITDNLYASINSSIESGLPKIVTEKHNALLAEIIDTAKTAVQGQSGLHLLQFYIYSNKNYTDDNYHTSISVTCGWNGTTYDYCAKLGKLPLDQPTKDNAIKLISDTSRSVLIDFSGFSIPNFVNTNNFWEQFDGYETDENGFSNVTSYYDANGNPVEN